jgi:uncharacterized protein YbaR (Trm112 family)
MAIYGWGYNEEESVVKSTVVCPVCKAIIDYRYKNEPASAYCNECKTTFVYVADNEIPVMARPDASIKKKTSCGCGRCGR